ncbi:MAG TPA: UbiA family prenyltransferase [Cytophagaceae bacterium]|jgi:1,4-dihydroxy-2-naphthoate octaprenyltransferase|nr:UbiA family prenyltransferase [Cytophagaceae bacterium]
MIKKSTIQHLRIPFSIYLMPFFCFAVSQSQHPNYWYLFVSFIVIHLFFNPASNAFNSYYDKDEESIGGLENPPPVDSELLCVSLVFDLIGQLLCFLISWQFALMVFIIGLLSKAYSHPAIRLKKYPFAGLLTVVIFQGAWTYLMSILAIENLSYKELITEKNVLAAGLCSLILLGSYPMTQVYQHGEDGRRGDQTISRILGIKGTFYWTIIVFSIGTAGFFLYFFHYYSLGIAFLFPAFMSPTLIYFFLWFLRVLKDEREADFRSTMNLTKISSISFIALFTFLYFFA